MTNIEILGAAGSVASLLALIAFAKPIMNWVKKINKPSTLIGYLESLQLRTQCRIAIVDDELTDFPINYLKNANYDITTFSSIEMSEFRQLTKFDIVFLDVQGVVKSDFQLGGAKLIKLLAKERPLQPIVAVSSGQFKTSLTDFFELSYDRLNKPVDEVRLSSVIEEICNETFNYESICSSIENLISCSKIKGDKFLTRIIINYLESKLSESDFEEFIHKKTSYKLSSKIIDKCKLLKDRINND